VKRFMLLCLGTSAALGGLSACGRSSSPWGTMTGFNPQIQRAASYRLEPRTTLNVNHPAFLHLEGVERGEPTLLVSSFGVFGGDAVRRLRGLNGLLSGRNLTTDVITDQVVWPNEVKAVPQSVLPGAYLVAGGFLVPGKTGALTMVQPNGAIQNLTKPGVVTEKKGGWFYHRVMWRDMDGDGRLDILTARAQKPIIGSAQGELLWLKNDPSNNGFWKETVIAQGPDVHFRLADLDGDGREEILASEFFSKRFSVHWKEANGWRSRTIDNQCGSAFDLEVADLNGDGRRDVVLTNHENNAKAGAFAYEVPQDWKTASWPRHTLAQGIQTRQKGPNQASPGAPLVIPAVTRGQKPVILLAGDGSQRVHIVAPVSPDRADWRYQLTDGANLGCTVGQLEAADLDGDGAYEVFAPAYDKHQIHVFTLRNTAASPRRR
jgi:hypothetical protein